MCISACQYGYIGVFGLSFDVVLGCAVDAGVVHAGKHEHLVVVFPADHTGLLLLGIFSVHLNYNSLKSASFIFLK